MRLAIGVLATVVVLHQTRERIRGHISRSGVTVERLIAGEADQLRDAFRRSLDGLSRRRWMALAAAGHLRGGGRPLQTPGGEPLLPRRRRGAGLGALGAGLADRPGSLAYRGVIGQYPGVKVGEFVVTPDLDSEGRPPRGCRSAPCWA